jgi:hypothetical protein
MSTNTNPFTGIQLALRGENVSVQYSVDASFTGAAPYSFNLLAYQDETFKEPLYSISGSNYYIIDNTHARQNQLPSFLYKLSLTTRDAKTYYSNFFGWHASDHVNQHKYLLAADISRREYVRFNYTGLYAYLLKRKSYGAAQINETDPVTGEPLVDNSVSYGVGSLGGYYDPVLMQLSIENRKVAEGYNEEGRGIAFNESLGARCVGFPFVDQHDIIVTQDAKRYTVIDAINKYFPGTTLIILQMPVLRLVPNTDTIYNIAVPDFPNEL